jgi:dolichol-phosphate mannosyltransferase
MLSVILPTYNERQNIAPLIERVGRALEGVPHELVFVDDSTDGTEAVIAEYAAGRPGIILIHRTARRGLATAVVDGMRRATGAILCVLDADLQHPPEVLPMMVEAADQAGADIVIASRNIAGGGYKAFTAVRHAASRAATALARLLLSRARLVSDPMSGFFAVRRHVIEDIVLQPLGYKILLEILVRGRFSRVAEVPYLFQARSAGQSKLTLRQQREYLQHLVRLMSVQPDDLRFGKFCMVGASGALLNMGILWFLTGYGVHYLLAGAAAVVLATTSNFLLNDAFTWMDRRSSTLQVRVTRYLRYWAVTGAAAAAQLALLFLLTRAGVPYLLSNLAGIVIVAVWNFRTNEQWTWKARPHPITRTVYSGRPRESAQAVPSGGGGV